MFRRTLMAGALALAASPAFAVTYTLDPGHTQVEFTWNHYGFSNPMAQFGKVDAKVDFDPADPSKSSVTATIPMNTVNSNIAKLDTRLQSADYFDAAKFPTATFKSTKVEKGATPDKLKVTGDLTLHGVTKPVTLDVTVNKVGEHPMRKAPAAGFEATAVIKRSDFGITNYVPNVSDDIRIHITTEAIESKAFAEILKQPPPK
jgi:polyisoprenoid-binding protein YceI